ncbi:5-methylthioadenosine/S-adenosylhomocysteine deaminase [Candidatus Hydrogenisulfobacillus filiaventi]|uniref:5-methylthioadenosine/S-adenosylhomocysteine deaminase n=1 Tax=Candidatus Hydrogenisulfobacillus filiaventi TaxID=2707344 RepID=A0A6F8ZDJ0_9FIRM|nr:5-methylthioadenosine/S-adenosylhomocysteine deaminase [Candidatus Hydrogenisulfobacillus filiaventi]
MGDVTVFRGPMVVTMDAQGTVLPSADVVVAGGRIAAIAPPGTARTEGATVMDAAGRVLIPGLVQTHVHLCQTLFRGAADDRELLSWLQEVIWPLEGAHDPDSVYASARLGIAELLRGGTTTILDMETVHHTEAAFQAIAEGGIRALSGKCLMDAGEEVPPSLREPTDAALQESVDLLERWQGRDGGRLGYAFAPRFTLSCSDACLKAVGELAERYRVPVHTHAAESRAEVDLVRTRRGLGPIAHFAALGLLKPGLIMAHGVWADADDLQAVAAAGAAFTHCPSSNLKLASGLADPVAWSRAGVRFGLGADGAPCNNTLDAFQELRLAALLPKPRYGPTAMPARAAFAAATIGGARVLGLEDRIGSIEPGKEADLVLLDWSGPHHAPRAAGDVYGQLVYQTRSDDVVLTMVAGRVVYRDGRLLTLDEAEVYRQAETAVRRVAARAGVTLPGPA